MRKSKTATATSIFNSGEMSERQREIVRVFTVYRLPFTIY